MSIPDQSTAAARFAALDAVSRVRYARAARILAEVRNDQMPFVFSDLSMNFAAKCGRLQTALEELLELVGMVPEQVQCQVLPLSVESTDLPQVATGQPAR